MHDFYDSGMVHTKPNLNDLKDLNDLRDLIDFTNQVQISLNIVEKTYKNSKELFNTNNEENKDQ